MNYLRQNIGSLVQIIIFITCVAFLFNYFTIPYDSQTVVTYELTYESGEIEVMVINHDCTSHHDRMFDVILNDNGCVIKNYSQPFKSETIVCGVRKIEEVESQFINAY